MITKKVHERGGTNEEEEEVKPQLCVAHQDWQQQRKKRVQGSEDGPCQQDHFVELELQPVPSEQGACCEGSAFFIFSPVFWTASFTFSPMF